DGNPALRPNSEWLPLAAVARPHSAAAPSPVAVHGDCLASTLSILATAATSSMPVSAVNPTVTPLRSHVPSPASRRLIAMLVLVGAVGSRVTGIVRSRV